MRVKIIKKHSTATLGVYERWTSSRKIYRRGSTFFLSCLLISSRGCQNSRSLCRFCFYSQVYSLPSDTYITSEKSNISQIWLHIKKSWAFFLFLSAIIWNFSKFGVKGPSNRNGVGEPRGKAPFPEGMTNTWRANAPHKKDFYPTGGPRAHFDSPTNHILRLGLHFFRPLVETALAGFRKVRIFHLSSAAHVTVWNLVILYLQFSVCFR